MAPMTPRLKILSGMPSHLPRCPSPPPLLGGTPLRCCPLAPENAAQARRSKLLGLVQSPALRPHPQFPGPAGLSSSHSPINTRFFFGSHSLGSRGAAVDAATLLPSFIMSDSQLMNVCSVGGNPVSAFLSWRLQATNACDVTLVWKSGFEHVAQYGISFKYVSLPFAGSSIDPRSASC